MGEVGRDESFFADDDSDRRWHFITCKLAGLSRAANVIRAKESFVRLNHNVFMSLDIPRI